MDFDPVPMWNRGAWAVRRDLGRFGEQCEWSAPGPSAERYAPSAPSGSRDLSAPNAPNASAEPGSPRPPHPTAEPDRSPAPHPTAEPGRPGPPHPTAELEQLGEEIAELSVQLEAASARLLTMIREFDARGGWNTGFMSCAAWLTWRIGLDPGAARERVRVARALAGLPLLAEALARGELSYAKVRALTRVATPETEARLLAVGRAGTAAHVERIVRGWRRVDRQAELRVEQLQHARREIYVRHEEDGTVVIRGRLPAEAGALLLRALEAGRAKLYEAQRKAAAERAEAKRQAEYRAWEARRAARRAAERAAAMAESAIAEHTPLTVAGAAAPETGLAEAAPAGAGLAEPAHVDGTAGGAGADAPSWDGRSWTGEGGDEPAGWGVAAWASAWTAGEGFQPSGSGGSDAAFELPTLGQQQADALVLLAESALHQGLDPGTPGERYQVVVHVDAPVLADADQPGQSVLEDGARVSPETSQRLACDASRVVMRHDLDGTIVEIGARTRTIPPALRRALQGRDRGCRFPGCGVRWGQGHHLRAWAQGGPTTLSNLALLCRRHHRAVHEEGYGVERGTDGELVFRRPNGQVLPHVPPAPELPDDPEAAIRAQNVAAGLSLDARTALPGWLGERLNVGYAIDVLHPIAQRGSPAPPETSTIRYGIVNIWS